MVTLPNGIIQSCSYDSASELTGINYQLASASLGSLTDGGACPERSRRDNDGRRTQLGGTWARTDLPNATTSTAVYNVANELTSWDGAALTYDPNGNMTGDGTNTYTCDSRNHLSGMSGVVGVSFVYDPFDRRQGKTIAAVTTNFLYDAANPVQELSGTAVTANLLTGLGIDEYFQRVDQVSTRNFLTDALGSTLALADSTGTVQTSYTYDPYGGTTVQGAASGNSYQYTGRENDGDGLYFLRARYYSPGLERLITQDPIGFRVSPNLYEYALASPLSLVDRFGLAPFPAVSEEYQEYERCVDEKEQADYPGELAKCVTQEAIRQRPPGPEASRYGPEPPDPVTQVQQEAKLDALTDAMQQCLKLYPLAALDSRYNGANAGAGFTQTWVESAYHWLMNNLP